MNEYIDEIYEIIKYNTINGNECSRKRIQNLLYAKGMYKDVCINEALQKLLKTGMITKKEIPIKTKTVYKIN